MEQDQQFVEHVLKAIVDNPDDVQVERTIDEMGVLISVTVNPADMGKVIGKSGQTAKAVRTLLKVVGAKNDARVNMKIIEPEGGTGGAPAATDDQPAADDQAAPGTTDAADDVPVSNDSVAEATAEQQQTDAAVPQASENDEAVDEATGEQVPEEPVSTTDEDPKANPLNEKSPLDEL